MVSRLVLGCGGVGHDLIERVRAWPGDLLVVAADHSRVTALRDENVRAVEADPTDAEAYPDAVDVVVVGSDDPELNRAATVVAREHFPDAELFVYTGLHPSDEALAAFDAHADHVVEPAETVATRLLEVVTGRTAERTRKLLAVLRDVDGRLAVVAHDNPDPDAIASALALAYIAESVGVAADACYFGEISHQENRALVNLLDLPLRNLEPGADLSEYAGVALVDHSRPGVNDGLPSDVDVDIVVDHHPPRAPVEGRFLDLRSDVGATSTLLTDYLQRIDLTPDRTLATALMYGIRIDTKDFSREVSIADFEAAAYLQPAVDDSVLDRVESPNMSADVLATLARAIRNRRIQETTLATGVGEIRDRDALAQAADYLLNMEDVNTTLVYGYREGTVYVSGRTRGTDLDLGETLRNAFGQIGSAGGHADMAGAQLPLGILADLGDESQESLNDVVEAVVTDRFFETIRTTPPEVSTGEYGYEHPFGPD